MKVRRWLNLVGTGLLFSVAIALVSFVFLMLEEWLTNLIWVRGAATFQHRLGYYLLVCLLGGLLLGALKAHWGQLPHTTHDTMAELRARQTVDYRPLFKHLLVATVILMFGAGVGPEAALLSAVISLSIWQADKLRYQYFQAATIERAPWRQRLLMRLHPLKYRQPYQPILARQTNKPHTQKLLIGLFIVNGLTTFILLMRLTKQPSFITRLGRSQWQLSEGWVILPALVLGWLVGWLYRNGSRRLEYLSNRWPQHVRSKALLGALVIFIFAIVLPRLLFSGQSFLSLVPSFSRQQPAAILFTAAALKLLFLQLCLKTGWVGGDIFPITFAALLIGFGCARLLPGIDTLLIVAVVAASCATWMLQSPIFPSIFIALFFPPNLLPVFAVLILIFYGLKKSPLPAFVS